MSNPDNSLVQRLVLSPWNAWNEYWFAPTNRSRLNRVRAAVAIVTAVWLASFWSDVSTWFGPSGVLSTTLAAQLLSFEQIASWQRLSPLWLADSQWIYYAWLLAGIAASLVVAIGIGGRIAVAVLLALVVGWCNRALWLGGPVQPALIAMLAYLCIEPGTTRTLASLTAGSRISGEPEETSWLAGLTLKLITTHAWLLIALMLASQLASVIWWRGEATWWLAAADQSYVLTRELLRDRPTLVNGITHAVILLELITLWLLTTHSARLLGIASGVATCGCVALLGGQLIYALLLSSCLLAFAALPSRYRE